MLHRTKRGKAKFAAFLGAAAVAVVLSLFWAGAASAAPGTLEICKANTGGAANVSFTFAVTKGQNTQSIVVVGGHCSDPISVASGNWVIQEDLSSALWVMTGATVTPASAWLSENDTIGKVKVAVTANAETQVTIANAQATATLKVCKFSAEPAFQGKEYSFTIGTTGVTAVAGATKGTAGCSAAVAVQPGSRLAITEAVPANQQVVVPVTATSQTLIRNQTGGVVKVTVGTGANIVYFENEPVGPPQLGMIELCKDAGDQFISTTKPFTFTITDHTGFVDTEKVLAGQCSGPVTVAAGNVNVAETMPDGTYVSDIFLGVNSAGALGPNNPTNGTATVVVPIASAGDVQLHFENSTFVTTLKVCKYLTASSVGLDGKQFYFTVTDAAGTQTVRITANTSLSGACRNVTDAPWSIGGNQVVVPLGDTVTVVETAMPYVGVNGGAPGAGGTVVKTVGAGINTISFVNQAYGQFEICKSMIATDGTHWNGIVFSFSVDGSTAAQPVAAGRCGQPQIVAAGMHTINEVNIPYGFQFVSSSATGPAGDNRGGTGGNPITVSVPYFNDSTNPGETLVTFTNKVQRAQIKICKVIEAGSQTPLGGLPYSFTGQIDGVSISGSVSPPYPGANACTGLLGGTTGIAIVDGAGNPVTGTVSETISGTYHVSAVSVDNVKPGSSVTLVGNTVTFTPGVGVVVVTITNRFGAV